MSDGDTNIVGGNVSADKVNTRVGGDLNIASVQDMSQSSAHQQSVGGGFDVDVKGNTDLKGAYIASTADPSKNQLTTGTLTFSDIQNHSDYSANSFGFGGGGTFGNGGANERTTGPSSGKNTGGIAPMLPQSESGSERGVTRSGVSEGTITLTNGANQAQDLASLNRDTSNLNETVNRTPDLQNLLNDQSRLMAAATAAGEAVARDIGTYADKKREAAQKLADATTDPELKAQYQKEADDWKEGGDYRAAMHAAGGAIIAGLGGGNALGGALGAGLTSKLGGALNELSENIQNARPTGNADIDQALAQIVATGVGTAVGAAVGGSSGAFTGYNVDRFNRQLHPDEYAMAKKNASVVAKQLGISEREAEGRIVAELLRNSDKQTSDAAGGVHDYEVRAIIGCQNLNCDGYKTDLQYANSSYNSQYIASNQQAYDAGQRHLNGGVTYSDLVKYNVKNNPISTAIAGAGAIALGGVVAGGVPSAIAMITGGGIGASVNTGAQYVFNNGQISLVDTAMAGVTGALTFGTGLLPGFLTNTGGALAGSAIKGDNPNMSMVDAAAGTVIGYGIGGKVESVIGNRVNPWYRAEWVDIGIGVSKYVPPSAIPSIAGTTAGAIASESTSAGVNAGPNLMPRNK